MKIGKHKVMTWKNKVYLSQDVYIHVLAWYHENLKHPGHEWMLATIHKHFTWKGIFSDIKKYVRVSSARNLRFQDRKSMVKYHFWLNQHKYIHGIMCMWIALGLGQLSSNTSQVEKCYKSASTLSQ